MTTSSVAARAGAPPNRCRVSERWLLHRYREHGDREARERLVESMMPLVRHVAAGYGQPHQREDLLQAALVGLTNAIERWDPARGLELRTYAIPTMRGEVRRWLRDHAWAMHVSRPVKDHVVRVTRVGDMLAARSHRVPTEREIAAATGLTLREVTEARGAAGVLTLLSLDAPPASGESAALMNALARDDEHLEQAEQMVMLAGARRVLDVRARRVLNLRYVEDLTQTEIAAREGCSQMQVSRILRRALDRLHDAAVLEPAA